MIIADNPYGSAYYFIALIASNFILIRMGLWEWGLGALTLLMCWLLPLMIVGYFIGGMIKFGMGSEDD